MGQIKLTETMEEAIVQRVLDDYNRDTQNRDEWLHKRADYRKQYRGVTEPKSWPWENASNLHVPVTGMVVDTLAPKLMKALFDSSPIANVRAIEKGDVERARILEQFLHWELNNHMKVYWTFYDIVTLTLIDGTACGKLTCERVTRTVREDGSGHTHGPAPTATAKGNKREIVVYEGPRFEVVDTADLIIPSNAKDLQSCDHLIHRCWVRFDDLKKRAAEGIYQNVDEDLKIFADDNSRSDPQDAIRVVEDDLEGVTTTGSDEANEIEILEWYGRYDVDEDGFEEECVFTVAKEARRLLRAVFLDDLFQHGKRPFIDFHFVRVPARFYSIGIPERIRDLQEEINALHNQRIDSGTVTNIPYFFYEPTSTGLPETLNLEPGRGYAVSDVNGILFPKHPDVTSFYFKEEHLVLAYIERILGISDFLVGRFPDTPNAPRTATGTMAVIQEANARIDLIIKGIQESFREFLEQVVQINQQYIAPETVIRVTGKDGKDVFEEIPRESIQGKFDYILSGNTQSINKQAQRQTSVFLYDRLINNSLIKGDPSRVFEVTRRLLLARDEKDIAGIIGQRPKETLRDQRSTQNGRKRSRNRKTAQRDGKASTLGLTSYLESLQGSYDEKIE